MSKNTNMKKLAIEVLAVVAMQAITDAIIRVSARRYQRAVEASFVAALPATDVEVAATTEAAAPLVPLHEAS